MPFAVPARDRARLVGVHPDLVRVVEAAAELCPRPFIVVEGLRSIAPPDGAFYIYADVAHLTDDSLSFCQRLLQDTGVATAPGVDFDPVEGCHFIRFSFAVSTPEIEDALSRLRPWFAALA